MQAFNPYQADEIVTQSDGRISFFGSISNSKNNRAELHEYEITMSGRLVLPELNPQREREDKKSERQSYVKRIEAALAGIPDGSGGNRNLHDFGVRLRRAAGIPGIAGSSGNCRSVFAARIDGAGDGIDGNQHCLFAMG
jgi:hypothetical protein